MDSQGLPGTYDSCGRYDGGDSAAILGTLQALSREGSKFTALSLKLWDREAGAPLRHPDRNRWYGQPDRFSRDQLIPVLCAGVAHGKNPFCDLIWRSHLQRGLLLAWNTRGNGRMERPWKLPDFTGPEIWALWLRYHRPWWRHLLLWAFDLETLMGSLSWRWLRKDRVSRNHMLVTLIGRKHSCTPVMWLAFKMNRWDDLVERWKAHCEAVGEYPTAALFQRALKALSRKN